MKSILLVKKFLGLVEMTSGLVNASSSLPEWQALKMIFFAPWVLLLFVFVFLLCKGCSVHGSGSISKIWSNLQITRYVESTHLFVALFQQLFQECLPHF